MGGVEGAGWGSRRILQVEQKPEGFFDLSQGVRWELAQLAFKVRLDERANALDIDHRGLIEEREVPDRHLIVAASVLRGQRDVDQEGTRGVGIISGDDDDRA